VELEAQVVCAEFSLFVEYDLFCVLEVVLWSLGEKGERAVRFWDEPGDSDIDLGGSGGDCFSQQGQPGR